MGIVKLDFTKVNVNTAALPEGLYHAVCTKCNDRVATKNDAQDVYLDFTFEPVDKTIIGIATTSKKITNDKSMFYLVQMLGTLGFSEHDLAGKLCNFETDDVIGKEAIIEVINKESEYYDKEGNLKKDTKAYVNKLFSIKDQDKLAELTESKKLNSNKPIEKAKKTNDEINLTEDDDIPPF